MFKAIQIFTIGTAVSVAFTPLIAEPASITYVNRFACSGQHTGTSIRASNVGSGTTFNCGKINIKDFSPEFGTLTSQRDQISGEHSLNSFLGSEFGGAVVVGPAITFQKGTVSASTIFRSNSLVTVPALEVVTLSGALATDGVGPSSIIEKENYSTSSGFLVPPDFSGPGRDVSVDAQIIGRALVSFDGSPPDLVFTEHFYNSIGEVSTAYEYNPTASLFDRIFNPPPTQVISLQQTTADRLIIFENQKVFGSQDLSSAVNTGEQAGVRQVDRSDLTLVNNNTFSRNTQAGLLLETASPSLVSTAVEILTSTSSLSFDYMFLNEVSEFSVFLGELEIFSTTSIIEGIELQRSVGIDLDFGDPTFGGVAASGSLLSSLTFKIDGDAGGQLLLWNILFNGENITDLETWARSGKAEFAFVTDREGFENIGTQLSTIPLPATGWLMLLAMAVLYAFRRKTFALA